MGNLPMTRGEALAWLKSMPQLESDLNHYLETEAIMRALAERLGEDIEYWGLLGLLHDVDWALTKSDWRNHCITAVEMLREKGFGDVFIENVQSHGYGYDEIPALKENKRTERIHHCLIAAETLTGIIHAYALMREKRVSDMEAKGLKKRFKDRKFAAGCDRELVSEIELAGLPLDELFSLAIEALKKVKDEIGLA